MLGNIWLKIKVFFLITIILATLSALFFVLVDKLANNINLQQSADNSFRYLEQAVKNLQYTQITNAFSIAAKVTISFDKKSRQVVFDTRAVDSTKPFAILDGDGSVVAGTFTGLNSFAGVPAVDRAIREGVASDGMLRINNEIFLLGAAPFSTDLGGMSKRLIAVSIVPLREAFVSIQIPFPVQIYSGETLIHEFSPEVMRQMLSGPFQTQIQSAMEQALKEGRGNPINRWYHVGAFTLPHDIRSPEKITFIGILSSVPGFELYRHVTTYIGVYAAIVIFITVVLTFLITYDIDRGFRNLAADISRLRVGEKLILHKYSHGAGLVVSALNHLIGTYQKHGETSGKVLDTIMPVDKEESEMMEIPEPSFDRKRPPVETPKANGRTGNTDPGIAKPAATPSPESVAPGEASSETDPYAALWESYKSIKIKNGEKISEQEQATFLAKLKTNRVSIMSKYNCRDVTFTIEEKEGKPVIKAKPVK